MNVRNRALLVGLIAAMSLLSWPPAVAQSAAGQENPTKVATSARQDGDDDDDPVAPVAPEHLDGTKKCLDCHGDLLEVGRVHGPVKAGLCTSCHEQLGLLNHDFRPIQNIASSCAECHKSYIGAITHEPVMEGDCMSCHAPHSSENPFLLLEPNQASLCGRCHEDQLGTGEDFIHGPVAAGVCTLCHEPHAGNQPGLLISSKQKLCLECHVDFRAGLNAADLVHEPVGEDCSLCHDPHASDHQFQLRQGGKALCLECHLDMGQRLENAVVSHSAVTTGAECLNCHRAHHAPFPKLLGEAPMGKCLECHQQSTLRPDGSEVTAIGQKLDESGFLHGPIRDGNCTACHEPHGSVEFALLRHSYPQSFYAPYASDTYSLCTQCHEVGAFEAEETETLTEFRDGSLNLHFLHVNKDPKGRTCRACHDTHSSNMPRHMVGGVRFGKWTFPLVFEKTPSGGSCFSGCHEQRFYNR